MIADVWYWVQAKVTNSIIYFPKVPNSKLVSLLFNAYDLEP